jgi:predicted RNA-binding protein with PIN domain
VKKLYVDGYNFIFRNPPLSRIHAQSLAHAREVSRSLLQRYAASKKVEVCVVYDSREKANGSAITDVGYLYEEIFVKDADAYLRNLAAERAESEDITIVSSDISDVLRPARGYGAKVMSSEEFFRLLEKSERKQREEPEKPPPPQGEEIDRWLKFFGEGEK